MALIRTYVDSGVLIYAAKAKSPTAELAIPFVTDPQREYVTSEYVRLEVLPKSKFNKANAETSFFEGFFAANVLCIGPSVDLMKLAMEEAVRHGISAIDALHVSAAAFAGAQELITSEVKSKPMHRTNLIKVVSIFPQAMSERRSMARRCSRMLHRLANLIERNMS